eukprot:16353852-Heterocapsa_arctica.AAC.1
MSFWLSLRPERRIASSCPIWRDLARCGWAYYQPADALISDLAVHAMAAQHGRTPRVSGRATLEYACARLTQ